MVALSPSHNPQVASPSAPLWPLAGMTPVHPCPFHIRQLRTGPSTAAVASPVLQRGKGPPLMQWCSVASDAPRERLLGFLVERVCCGLIVHQRPSLQSWFLASDRIRIWIFAFNAPSVDALMLHTSQKLQHCFSQQPLLIDTSKRESWGTV